MVHFASLSFYKGESMALEDYLDNFKNCLEKEEPFCRSACPFRFDVIGMMERIKRGAYRGAYQLYRDRVVFPEIVSILCPKPCEAVCPRKDYGGSLRIRDLEKAVVENTEDRTPTVFNVPKKEKTLAIIGGGISGLAVLARLAAKNYRVTLYEKSHRLGGHLWERLPDGEFLKDMENQLSGLDYTLKLNHEVKDLKEVLPASAVFVATGKGGQLFSASHEDDLLVPKEGEPLLVAGGRLFIDDDIYSLSDSLDKAVMIDNYFRTGRIIPAKKSEKTKTVVDKKTWLFDGVKGKEGQPLSKEEMLKEAQRCFLCQCDFCRTNCDILEYVDKWPLRVKDEVVATTIPGWSEVKATPAKRLMSSSNLEDLLKEVCPEKIDLDGLLLEGRKSMHRQDKAPWAFHDFWLKDMDHADSEKAALGRMKGDKEKCDYLFFPGCQLGASRPDLLEKAVDIFFSKEENSGLLLQCCGVPALWAGREDEYNEKLNFIRSFWEKSGRPTVVTTCPTCQKRFKEDLEEIPVISYYEWLEHKSVDIKKSDKEYAIFDACAARDFPKIHEAVRSLAERAGNFKELPEREEGAKCCSFGGQSSIANPGFKDFVVEKRSSLSHLPYITYCVNCRDAFLDKEKEAVHILDLVFGTEKEIAMKVSTESERRRNRETLKRAVLKKQWAEEVKEEKMDIELVMSKEVEEKISGMRILEEEIIETIVFLESTGRKIRHEGKNTSSGYKEIGYMTYWVEYEKLSENKFKVHNAYSHRMKIELEEVWDGRKRDDHM